MRFWVGHPLGAGFWGGVSVGRYRRGRRPYSDGGCGGCLVLLAFFAIIGLAIDYWPVTLGVFAVGVAAALIHARHRVD